jgi:hypothetical protein
MNAGARWPSMIQDARKYQRSRLSKVSGVARVRARDSASERKSVW